MKKIFPIMLDRPEKGAIIPALVYSIICFFSFPFLLLLFMSGSYENTPVVAWGEIAYHLLNFFVAIFLFREFLSDSLLNVQIHKKKFFLVTGSCAAVVLGYGISNFLTLYTRYEMLPILAAYGTLPLAEMEVLMLSSDTVLAQPIFGTLCMTVITPVTVSCLYYATSFAPGGCRKPWLGYLLVCIVLALPRLANGMTLWDPTEELILYFLQLPIHLVACWGFQQTDSIWTPIATLSVSNLVYSLLYLAGHAFLF